MASYSKIKHTTMVERNLNYLKMVLKLTLITASLGAASQQTLASTSRSSHHAAGVDGNLRENQASINSAESNGGLSYNK